jgi:hypothetical protein
MLCRNAAERSYYEEGSRRRDDAWSKIAHETNDALTLPRHVRTPSGCKSGDIKRTIIKKSFIMLWCVIHWSEPSLINRVRETVSGAGHLDRCFSLHKVWLSRSASYIVTMS